MEGFASFTRAHKNSKKNTPRKHIFGNVELLITYMADCTFENLQAYIAAELTLGCISGF